MTLFFGGEAICALSALELENWHLRISERLEKSGFHLEGSRNEAVVDTIVTNFAFCMKGLKVFPPHRNNLVVAIFEANPEWHDLNADIRRIAMDKSCSPELARICGYCKQKWIAHVTLGNLSGGRKAERKSLDTLLLKSVFESTDIDSKENGMLITVETRGMTMGGLIPRQLELDWNFVFSGRNGST